ncbi:MAG: DUF6356 family protein [Actinomycetota bacterium]|nr:DUF6356 family protein [Actinomycetota bacterium]
MRLRTFFTEHPTSVGETYLGHLYRALGVAWRLVGASAACVVHAFVPAFFTTRASDTVSKIHDEIQQLGGPETG